MWRPTPSVGDPDGDRFLVDIQSNVLAKLRHDLSSSMRLCASVLTLKRNPRQTRMDRSLHLLYQFNVRSLARQRLVSRAACPDKLGELSLNFRFVYPLAARHDSRSPAGLRNI